jgi:small ligand-binding sensory domain FIST
MSIHLSNQTMEFASRTSTAVKAPQIIADLSDGVEGSYDVGFFFTAYGDKGQIDDVLKALPQKINIRNFIGCTCAGIIGTSDEIENRPAVSLILARLPGVRVVPFFINEAQLEQMKVAEDWYNFLEVYPNENPVFLTIPDPFLLDLNRFLAGMNGAYPGRPVIGGLASGAIRANDNILILNKEQYRQGAIGLVLTGDLNVETIVSQGCRPIGETFIVTKAEENIIYEVAGRPLYDVLTKVLDAAPAQDKLLAQDALFVGIAMDEYQHEFRRGDFLIRGLIGIDSKTGAGAIADFIRAGQTIQFHVRDAMAATEDLQELLRQQQERKRAAKPKGALVFSCNGRGERLFREKDHDIHLIQQHLGPLPTAGFFCAGEIGPVGHNNYLHGFTNSMALFYPKADVKTPTDG